MLLNRKATYFQYKNDNYLLKLRNHQPYTIKQSKFKRQHFFIKYIYFSKQYLLLINRIFKEEQQYQMSQTIKVVVRVRPMNTKQKDRGCSNISTVDDQNGQLSLLKPDDQDNVKTFAYDSVFGQKSEQAVVYKKTAYNLVENVIEGYNGTIFAYGQTGCGKTHSMVGDLSSEEHQGIIPRSFGHILKTISESTNKQFLLRCSFIEIYNEEVRDLLSKDVKAKLQVKQSPDKGVFIKDLSINAAKTHQQLMEFMNIGNKSRTTGETAMNKDSSRSHLLFSVYLQSANITSGDQEKKYIGSKLNLVDLAGSERLSKTGAAGDRLKQAQKINLSLSALGNVISALVDGKSQHIPYRDSKLTRLLQDSLGGNTKTVMIANISPADYNFDQTLSTLRYASRAKFIKNKPIINQDPKDAQLKEYASQIEKLKKMLEGKGMTGQSAITANNQSSNQYNSKLKEKEEELLNQKQEKEKLQKKIKQLQSRHIEAKDVHISNKIIEDMVKISQIKEKKTKPTRFRQGVSICLPEDEQIEIQKDEKNNTKYTKVIKGYKNKIKQLQNEIKDVGQENYVDKQLMLDDIRFITQQNKFLETILGILLQKHQIEQIRQSSTYNEEKQQYKVPPFYVKNKQLVFPKLQQNQSIDMIRQMQQGRHLQWNKDDQKQNMLNNNSSVKFLPPKKKLQDRKPSKDFAINNLIREARQEKIQTQQKSEKKIPRKLMLDPIMKI